VIVLDASAIVELIVEPRAATGALRARLQADPDIHVPHLVDAEVTNALRRQLLAGQLDILGARRAGRPCSPRDARLGRVAGHRARVEVV
jgi:predicted nucleic acid-binding protein